MIVPRLPWGFSVYAHAFPLIGHHANERNFAFKLRTVCRLGLFRVGGVHGDVARPAALAVLPDYTGGRLVVSDLVLLRPLPDAVRNSVEAYVGCIAGASLREEYLELMRAAGFRDVQIVQESRYPAADGVAPQDNPHDEALSYVVSAKVRARKPA